MSKDLTDALRALTDAGDANVVQAYTVERVRQLAAKPRGKAEKQVSAAPLRKSVSSAGGGGIVGPLTEPSYGARTFWPNQSVPTTDGLFAITWAPPKQLTLADANLVTVVINLAQPV